MATLFDSFDDPVQVATEEESNRQNLKVVQQPNGLWSVLNIPIFVPTRKVTFTQDGKKIVRNYTPEVLDKIVANWKARLSTGYAPPTMVYHLSDNKNKSLSTSTNEPLNDLETNSFQSGNRLMLSGTGKLINPRTDWLIYPVPDNKGNLAPKKVKAIYADAIDLSRSIINLMLAGKLPYRSPDIRWLDENTPEFRCLAFLPESEVPHNKLPMTNAATLAPSLFNDSFGDIQLVDIQKFVDEYEKLDEWKKYIPKHGNLSKEAAEFIPAKTPTPLEELIKQEEGEQEISSPSYLDRVLDELNLTADQIDELRYRDNPTYLKIIQLLESRLEKPAQEEAFDELWDLFRKKEDRHTQFLPKISKTKELYENRRKIQDEKTKAIFDRLRREVYKVINYGYTEKTPDGKEIKHKGIKKEFEVPQTKQLGDWRKFERQIYQLIWKQLTPIIAQERAALIDYEEPRKPFDIPKVREIFKKWFYKLYDEKKAQAEKAYSANKHLP
ncbi:MAG: hypothetical protein ACTSYF_00695, partial [Promethearchaeota archaeon]